MFEFNMAELLRHRWGRLRLYRFPGSVLTDYRILKNYAKTTPVTSALNGDVYAHTQSKLSSPSTDAEMHLRYIVSSV